MTYSTRHTTTYVYGEQVSLSHNQVKLTPRACPGQRVLEAGLEIRPKPEAVVSYTDYFGNTATFFCLHELHTRLEIVAESVVDVVALPEPDFAASLPWEAASARIRDDVRTFEFVFDSTFVRTGDDFREYAIPSFTPGRPVLEAAHDLCGRIHTEFSYQPYTTGVDTPVESALRDRRGVCQDYAQVMIGCLRSLGLAARYVSGYIRSGEGRVGADASHAWVSVYSPGTGWTDFDPTNNRPAASGEHVTLAWGRDYTDVSPMKGVMVGGGEHLVHVAVGVVPEPAL